ncbi:hypothetical protein [Ligilactobacillus agilis]|uniref:hypothetical protein n=1 Tax=Ligilactobacillus agilis TaxID=1601 RepID=UPI003D8078A6
MELGGSMVLMNLKNGEFAVKVILGILIVASIVALFKIWIELKKRKDVIAFFNKYNVIGKLEYEQAFKIEVMEYKLKDTNRNLKFWLILTYIYCILSIILIFISKDLQQISLSVLSGLIGTTSLYIFKRGMSLYDEIVNEYLEAMKKVPELYKELYPLFKEFID